MKKIAALVFMLGWVVVSSATASVRNVHKPDGSLCTWYDIDLQKALPGATLAEVDSITVRRDGTDLGFSLEDFAAYTCCGGWQAFFLEIPGSPALGEYEFILTAGEREGSYTDTQRVNVTIPLPDESSMEVHGDTFSWDPVELSGTPLFYRLEISNLDGDRVYASSRVLDMVSHTIPPGRLTPGERYLWRVRITDSSDYYTVQNRSHSQWVDFPYRGGMAWMWVQRRTTSAGERINYLSFGLRAGSGGYVSGASAADLTGLTLLAPSGTPVSLSAFSAANHAILFGTYSGGEPEWASAGFTPLTEFWAVLSSPLETGTYRLEVTFRGRVYQAAYTFRGVADLPVVASSSFRFETAPSGEVTWTWSPPESMCGAGGDTSARAIIVVYREGGKVGVVYITVPTCLGSLLIPAAMADTLNRMGDSFEFIVQLRTNDESNRTYSRPVVLERVGEAPAPRARLQGRVTDAVSGAGIEGARLVFTPGGREIVTGAGGAFSVNDLAPGIYQVTASATLYYSRLFSGITVSPGPTNHLDVLLDPRAPQVTEAAAHPAAVFNDGGSATLLTALVTHPDGAARIAAVTADLSAVGGLDAEPMRDDGLGGDAAAGDGVYSLRVTVPAGTPARDYTLDVEAVDDRGFAAAATVTLSVAERVQAEAAPAQSVSLSFVNTLGAQTLRISIVVTLSAARGLPRETGCHVDLTIYRPDGSVYGTYQVKDALDITIPAAEPGNWRYETVNRCDTALSYKVETRGSGTGTLAGRVVDAYTGQGVTGALVTCNTGGSTRSRAQGYYAGVVVAGTGEVATTRSGYQARVQTGVTVSAGETTHLDIRLVPETAPLGAVPRGSTVREILVPADDPRPPEQPLAAKIRDGKLEVNALFPSLPVPVDVFLALDVDVPGLAGRLLFFDEAGALVPFEGRLLPWRRGIQSSGWVRVLPPVPVTALPPADYRFYCLLTPDVATLEDFDLTYFTKTIGQAPPSGQVTREVPSPSDTPVPVLQPLAVTEAEGKLRMAVYFPPQEAATTLYIGAYSLGPPARMWYVTPEGGLEESAGTLSPWRREVRRKQSGLAAEVPAGTLAAGTYMFFSLRSPDPAGLSRYELVYFTRKIGG